MDRRWVVNASPLIALGKLNLLSLWARLSQALVVPSAVVEEIGRGSVNDPAREWLSSTGQGFIRDAGPVEPIIAGWDLGLGESHVLTWTLRNRGFEAILDDRASRKCAASLSVPVRGTLGVLLLAKQEGLIGQLKPLLSEMQRGGFRVHPEVRRKALHLAGETL